MLKASSATINADSQAGETIQRERERNTKEAALEEAGLVVCRGKLAQALEKENISSQYFDIIANLARPPKITCWARESNLEAAAEVDRLLRGPKLAIDIWLSVDEKSAP